MHGGGVRGWGMSVCLVCWCVACLFSWTVAANVVQKGSAVVRLLQGPIMPVCRGLHKAEVEWWVMLKHPGGYQYSYVDSDSSGAGSCAAGLCWRHGLSMQDPNPVSHTLEVLASASDSLGHVIYNDADPGGTEHFDHAHAKGVVAFAHTAANVSRSPNSSSTSGFWLVHSAPRFPHSPGEPDWMQLQHPQSVFGQHFSCYGLGDNSSIAAVADVLLMVGPYVVSSRLPSNLALMYPVWKRVLAGAFIDRPAALNTSLATTAGQPLLAFAKSKLLNVSLTDAVVGPGLGVGMFWETWRRSHDALPSACFSRTSPLLHSSLNVAQVAFPHTSYRWNWERDHSKWGLSSSSSSSNERLYVCLGDLNRAGWQAHRGGGYVCMQHTGLWQAFHAILAAAESCVWHA